MDGDSAVPRRHANGVAFHPRQATATQCGFAHSSRRWQRRSGQILHRQFLGWRKGYSCQRIPGNVFMNATCFGIHFLMCIVFFLLLLRISFAFCARISCASCRLWSTPNHSGVCNQPDIFKQPSWNMGT